jgi:hypothetical protein
MHLARLALVVTVALAACASPRVSAPAPAAPADAAPSLAGTWTLIAADAITEDGTRVKDYGESPAGLLIVDPDGRYSIQIYRTSGRPPFASGDKAGATPAELSAAVIGSSTHIGRCAIDPGGTTLTFHVEHAVYPNWEGTTQVRPFTLRGDELEYKVISPTSKRVAISVWHRVRRG